MTGVSCFIIKESNAYAKYLPRDIDRIRAFSILNLIEITQKAE
jgi:hypothetical protein